MGCSSSSGVLPIGGGGSRRQKLGSLDLEGVVDYIESGRCRNVIWLSGAGVSVSAGIPDFRSAKGLYSSLAKYRLPAPECVFDIEFFRNDPRPFYDLARKLYPGKHRPTPTHFFVRLLHERGLLLRNWTQNIDMLERLAGIPEKAVVEAHGSFGGARCSGCGREGDPVMVRRRIEEKKEPQCRKCGGHLKPDITFFGEPLPQRVAQLSKTDFKRCDLLVVAGTSLAVQPVAGFIQKIPRSTPRLLCNRTVVGSKEMNDNCDSLTDGFLFGRPDNYRDVLQLGDCDDTVRRLAAMLGWTEDLEHMMSTWSYERAAMRVGGCLYSLPVSGRR